MLNRGEEERILTQVLEAFRKHGGAPLAAYMHTCMEGGTVAIQGMGTVHKETPHKCDHGNTEASAVSPACCGIVVNKQGKGKVLASRTNVHIERIKPSKSREGFLARVKESDEKGAREKGAWVQPERQLLHPEKPLCRPGGGA
ncbi:60S ribosomal protein L21 [Tupaia chinensis]|uniref:60S ribosomal protein L21 n=1 Tax=Tupaia chinensis TaxID=246437 RepID=L9KL59_TUPCH|nr:60S ribosomal protein L21 [Tupaia chinensis]